jgi:protoheme IX farnesyltransferase
VNIGELYRLTKPGVLYGNALTTVAGFLLASKGRFEPGLFLATVAGSTLIIASATTINNYLDRDIDRLMERTKNRALVSGLVKPRDALIFGILLGCAGVALLVAYVSWLVAAIGLVGFVDYVFFYGALAKRRSWHGTLVGSISGAIPILAGYVAAAGGFDLGAWLVFAVLFFWQMPEFYSIAIFRRKEYKAAGVPVITVIKTVAYTKLQILMYVVAFTLAALALTLFGFTGIVYALVMASLCLYWVRLGAVGFRASDSDKWARKMFRFSLTILLVFCFLISVDNFLP